MVDPEPTSSSKSDAEAASGTSDEEAAPVPVAASQPTAEALPLATATAVEDSASANSNPNPDPSPASPPPLYPPVDLPCMRARLRVEEDGAHVFEGRWGMTAAAHDHEEQTSPFELRLAPPPPGAAPHAVPASGTFSGFFMLQQLGGKPPLRVDERQVRVTFAPRGAKGGEAQGSSDPACGVFDAQGSGRNRFGSFVITGRFVASSGEVELFRSYVKATKASESRKRHQTVKDRAGAPAQRARTQAARPAPTAAKGGHPTQGGKSIQGLSQALPRSDSSDQDPVQRNSTGRVPRSSRGDWKDKADMPRRGGSAAGAGGNDGSLPLGTSSSKSRGKGKQAPGGAVGGLPAPPGLVASLSSSLPSSLADGTLSKAGRLRRVPSHLQDQPETKPVRLKEPLRKCAQVLKTIMGSPNAVWFNKPVDPVALDIPDYLTVVKQPMDLSTVKANLESGALESPEDFKAAVLLVFSNAVLYNTNKEHAVNIAARALRQTFEEKFRAQVQEPLRRAAELEASAAASKTAAAAARSGGTANSSGASGSGSSGAGTSTGGSGGGGGSGKGGGAGKKSRSTSGKNGAGGAGAQPRARAGRVKSGPRTNQASASKGSAGAGGKANSSSTVAPRAAAAACHTAGMVPLSQVQEIQRQMLQMQETINMLQRQTSQNEQLQSHLQLSAATSAPAPSRKKNQDDHRPLSETEKVSLRTAIETLPDTKLPRIIEIIRERMPGFSDEDQVIEIDINALDTPTLRHLQRYVKSCSKKRKSASKQQPSPGIPELDIDLQSLEATALGTDEYKRMRPDTEIGLDLPFTPSDLPDGLDAVSEDNFGP